ncbi:phage exclusion protein Lit family protein [Tenacibaculum amylolyticum]|uniref:phage exclusion protein Lit family protein n=1 Tax=Tenacibaculum amylolyticum TaxID=104269 RepID=UPI0038939168
MDWFLNVTPDFKDEFDFEVDSNDLRERIQLHLEQKPIREIAQIDKRTGIEIYENFNQFLWCCSYAMFVVFDEGIQKPSLNGVYKGELDMSNPFVRRAMELFGRAISLFETYDKAPFYNLPNPEKYHEFEQFYIERTSGVYCAAMTFILLHEFGHQYFGHLDYYPSDTESKQDELTADEFAFDKMATHFETERSTTYKFGIIVGLSSLIFVDKTLQGGDRHPDPDQRLVSLIEKMNLNELDNLWGVASLAFKLWGLHFNKSILKPSITEHYKQMFYDTLNDINGIKGSS